MYVISDEGESVRTNEHLDNSSEFTYKNKGAIIDMSSYDRVLSVLKKLDTSYIPK